VIQLTITKSNMKSLMRNTSIFGISLFTITKNTSIFYERIILVEILRNEDGKKLLFLFYCSKTME
jgi:hypothetical protein